MHVAMASIFQSSGQPQSDGRVYRNEVTMADLAEPPGFDSVFSNAGMPCKEAERNLRLFAAETLSVLQNWK